MIECYKGANVVSEQRIYQTVVKIKPLAIDGSFAFGKNTRPGDGETVGIQTQFSHQCYILWHTMIVVGRYLTGMSHIHFAGCGRELIPDGEAPTIFKSRAFDLISRCRSSP